MTDLSNSPIGKSIVRKEDFRFLTGVGQYTDDVQMPRQTYAAFLRSPHAHARILSIDTSAAEAYELLSLSKFKEGWREVYGKIATGQLA